MLEESFAVAFKEGTVYHELVANQVYEIELQLIDLQKEYIRPRAVFNRDSAFTVFAIGSPSDGTFETLIVKDKHRAGLHGGYAPEL